MFDIGLGELVVLAAVALLVFGPDRLPKAAAQAVASFATCVPRPLRRAKSCPDSADLGDIQSDFKSIADLHPKRLVSSMLSDPTPDPASAPAPAPAARPASAANRRRPSPTATSSAAGRSHQRAGRADRIRRTGSGGASGSGTLWFRWFRRFRGTSDRLRSRHRLMAGRRASSRACAVAHLRCLRPALKRDAGVKPSDIPASPLGAGTSCPRVR